MLLRNESILTYGCIINLYYDDDTELHTELKLGDMIDVLYNYNGIRTKCVGKLVNINPIFRTTPAKVNPCFCHYDDSSIAQLVIDVSGKYKSEVRLVNIDSLLDLKVLESQPAVETEVSNLAEVLTSAKENTCIKLNPGIIVEPIEINTPGLTLIGNGTVMQSPIKVNAPGVSLQNFIIGINAGDTQVLSVNTTQDFSMEKCKILASKDFLRTPIAITASEINIENCVFDARDKLVYNMIEGSLDKEATPVRKVNIIGNQFKGTLKNNAMSFYHFEDGAEINITNNLFEYAGNALRISNITSNYATININNCEYKATCDGEYAGFVIFEDYSKDDAVQNFTRITMNISNLIGPSGQKMVMNELGTDNQVYYIYDDRKGILANENQPRVRFIN